MAHRDDIRAGMQVLGSDGGMIGVVGHVHEEHVHVEPTAPNSASVDSTIPLDWVARVDDHVHLNVTAGVARQRWGGEGEGAAGAYAPTPPQTPARDSSWIPWAIGIVLLLAVLFFGIRGCDYAAEDTDYRGNASDVNMTASDMETMGNAAGNSGY